MAKADNSFVTIANVLSEFEISFRLIVIRILRTIINDSTFFIYRIFILNWFPGKTNLPDSWLNQ